MNTFAFRCPVCKSLFQVNTANNQAKVNNWHYLIIFRLHQNGYSQANDLLIKRFGACFSPIDNGIGIIISAPHAYYISNEITLCLGDQLKSLMVFHIDSDAVLKFHPCEYARQIDVETLLGLRNNK